jgi:hypothetical protein
VRLNPAASTYSANLRYQFDSQVLPRDAVPVLALCNAMAAGERLAITTLDGQILAAGIGPFGPANWPDGDDYLRCARQLAEIQDRAGAFFPLPGAFEPEDQHWMDYASSLLRGEDVLITWPGSAGHCDRDQAHLFLEETAKIGPAFAFSNSTHETLEFAGGKIPLGLVTETAHSARLANRDELKTWYDSGSDERAEIRLAPASNNQMTVRLGGTPGSIRIGSATQTPEA